MSVAVPVTGMCGEELSSIVSSRLLSDLVRSRTLFRMPRSFDEEQPRLHVPAEAPKSKSGYPAFRLALKKVSSCRGEMCLWRFLKFAAEMVKPVVFLAASGWRNWHEPHFLNMSQVSTKPHNLEVSVAGMSLGKSLPAGKASRSRSLSLPLSLPRSQSSRSRRSLRSPRFPPRPPPPRPPPPRPPPPRPPPCGVLRSARLRSWPN